MRLIFCILAKTSLKRHDFGFPNPCKCTIQNIGTGFLGVPEGSFLFI